MKFELQLACCSIFGAMSMVFWHRDDRHMLTMLTMTLDLSVYPKPHNASFQRCQRTSRARNSASSVPTRAVT